MNEKILREAGFENEVNAVKNKICPICLEKINYDDFKDTISKKEFGISGICQKCQDKIFTDEGGGEEDE